ncbi:hypothetical protein, partial [Pseudomonas soli]|uniref:hypothetical protein n=1 Tax=Pseudomonas soli TaxID=1306993 RepID=UPI0028B0489B
RRWAGTGDIDHDFQIADQRRSFFAFPLFSAARAWITNSAAGARPDNNNLPPWPSCPNRTLA